MTPKAPSGVRGITEEQTRKRIHINDAQCALELLDVRG